jgi:hypothetical protein
VAVVGEVVVAVAGVLKVGGGVRRRRVQHLGRGAHLLHLQIHLEYPSSHLHIDMMQGTVCARQHYMALPDLPLQIAQVAPL